MGADLIINCVFMKGKKSFAEREKRMLKEVEKINFEKKLKEYQGFKEIKTPEELKEHYIQTIKDFIRCLGFRDVTYLQHKGEMIYLTGGMSWGDDPTGSFSTFEEFLDLDKRIVKAGEFS